MLNPDSHEDLIDAFYEAAMAPELWPAALSTLANAAGAAGALLLQVSPAGLSGQASPEAHDDLAAFFAEGWHLRNPRTARLIEMHYAGFVRDVDVFTLAELENDPLQRDFLRARGYGRELGSVVPLPSGDILAFSIHYPWAEQRVPQAAIERLDPLRPHLARAALLSGRLWADRARTAIQAFQSMGLAAAAVSRSGNVITSNELFSDERLIVAAAGNRISLRDRGARALFDDALKQLQLGLPKVLSILIPAEHGVPASVLHLLPLRGVARDFFASGLTLVVLTSMSSHASPAADLLHALFDLTPAEARLARGLAAGYSLPELAIKLSVSHETARTHLKAVLLKTGTNRQTALVRFLSQLSPVAEPVRKTPSCRK